MIYLDNAATTFPKPECVLREFYGTQKYCGANPGRGGHSLSMKAGQKVYSCREKLAEMFECSAENVAFTNNCTTALNTAINGIVSAGDHIVISSLEHNSVLRPVHRLYERGVITYSVARVNPFDDNATLRNFADCICENTKAVVMTHVSNVFGTVLPVDKIAALCKVKGILFILDAAQSAGSHKISMKKQGIDILCMPGHKGLLGPMGTGALLFDENVAPEALTVGGTGSFSLASSQPEVYPDRLESGTLNLPGIAAMGKGIDFIKSFGGERAVLEKESELISLLKEDLSVIRGVSVCDELHGGKSTNVLSFTVGEMHSEMTASMCDRCGICLRAGYHCSYLAHKSYGTSEMGTVRVSTGIFNTKKDIKNLVFCLNKIALAENLC